MRDYVVLSAILCLFSIVSTPRILHALWIIKNLHGTELRDDVASRKPKLNQVCWSDFILTQSFYSSLIKTFLKKTKNISSWCEINKIMHEISWLSLLPVLRWKEKFVMWDIQNFFGASWMVTVTSYCWWWKVNKRNSKNLWLASLT